MAFRRAAWLAALAALAPAIPLREAAAAPEVHRLNLVLSSNPTQLVAQDFNDFLDDYNRIVLRSRGLEGLDKITSSWLHQAELRYFVRPNIAVSAGFGQIRSRVTREFLPRISQSILLRAEVISVPVHVGAAYYLQPYTQGDFQARAYLGGGFVSLTNNKVIFEQVESATDSATTLDHTGVPLLPPGKGSTRFKGRRDAPGFYLEIGGHMFFASRYSVMLGGIYRSAVVRNLHVVRDVIDLESGRTVTEVTIPGADLDLDVGGLGVRLAVGIGF